MRDAGPELVNTEGLQWSRNTHEDGTEGQIAAGEAYVIEPGHDAWVVGNEPFVGLEFESRSAETYATA